MSETTSTDAAQGETPEAAPARRRKPSVDQKLADAKDFALAALTQLVPEAEIGEGHRVQADDERLVTHYFPSLRRGYKDWEWYVTIARAPRQTEPTVCETGLLPAEGALLAPEWVPWSERLRDDEKDDAADIDPDADPEVDPDSDESGAADDEAKPAEVPAEDDASDDPTD
ncbi:DUF3027 domain-containing protein [Kocuria sp. JC486]|uniref:DUF3027 domain-containing protein n=1 Tax=Kocuria soli TaxID=2485125 RepID=A0A3N3ZM39_9MICC|nr:MULTISPECIES: DUF3027 domain-containing protein [Kocuria]NHU85243.1 DUF3027 domain-containing protein [Kocuria sp. JC486]ROZ61684.1 DUF3027 domain-containing protein [Kocuria soli]